MTIYWSLSWRKSATALLRTDAPAISVLRRAWPDSPRQRHSSSNRTNLADCSSDGSSDAGGSYGSRSDIAHLLAHPTWSVRSLLPPRYPPHGAMQNDTPPHSSSASSSSASAPTSASPSAPPPPPPPPPGISRAKLHHLCRLAALPAPQSPAAEARVLRTLAAQLHFVRAIQRVDTAGVEPLRSVRDETAEHAAETELTVESLRAAFDAEEMVGWSRRIVRRRHRRPYLPSTSKQGGPSADAGGPLAAAGAAATTTTGAFTGAGAGADASTSSSTSNSAATVAHDGATNAAEDWDVLGLAARSAGRYFVVETSAK